MSPKQTKAKKTPQKGGKVKTPQSKKKAPIAAPESDEEDSSEEESDDEATVPVPAKALNGKKKEQKAQESSDDDDDDEDEEAEGMEVEDDDDSSEEEEEQKPVKPKKQQAPTKGKKAKVAEPESESDDDDDDDEDDESDEESEEEEPPKKRKSDTKAAKQKPAKKAKIEKEESEDDEDSSDEEDDDEEEEEEPAPKKKKEKKAAAAAENVEGCGIKLFIRGYAEQSDGKLRKFFSKNGITVAEIHLSPFKQLAFVELVDTDDLDKALALNGESLNGTELLIEKAKNREEAQQNRQKTRDEENKVKMFVRNVGGDVTEEMLKEHFDGAINSVIPTNDDGSNKNFGFVFFNTEDEVNTAVEDKQGSELAGQALFLDFSGAKSQSAKKSQQQSSGSARGEKGKSKVLFVGNLSYHLTEDQLQEAFENSTAARILTQKEDPSKSRGVGFVDFNSVEDAEAAFNAMQGEELDGRNIKVDFAAERGSGGGGGGGGFRGGRGGRGGGRGGGFRGGRGGGFRGGRGGDRGGRGGFRGGRGRGGFQKFAGKKTSFDD